MARAAHRRAPCSTSASARSSPRRPSVPGSPAGARSDPAPAALTDRGLPAAAVRGRRHADLPGREQPAADVRRARGPVAAAVPDGRPGPAPPAALAGGRGQVLPARRVRLGVLPLRPGAALRLRRLGRPRRASPPRSHGTLTDVRRAALRGLALLVVGLLFKAGIAPFHSWTPDVYQGAPTPVTAFMAACTKVAAFGAILRVLYVGFARRPGTGGRVIWARRDRSRWWSARSSG